MWLNGNNDDWPRARTVAHLRASIEVVQQTADECVDAILAAAHLMAQTFRAGGKVLLCGNGGSAADCQHMAAELVSRLTSDFERPGLPAIALTTDTSFLTAFANDRGFDGIFARQVQALGRSADLLFAISTSGNSINVMQAVTVARQSGLHTIALTGSGGCLAGMVDIVIAVPSSSTQCIQQAHLIIEHALCDVVERHVFGQHGGTAMHAAITPDDASLEVNVTRAAARGSMHEIA